MELNEATLQQLIQTYGQAAVDAAGLSQQLQYAQSMGILLYYSADLNANMNVAQESAQGITMDTLPTLEADYAAAYASMGITNYDMAGPGGVFRKNVFIRAPMTRFIPRCSTIHRQQRVLYDYADERFGRRCGHDFGQLYRESMT